MTRRPAAGQRALDRVAQSFEPFEMTFPLKGVDGDYRPFLTRVVPIRNEQGEVTRWFGTNVDISDLAEAEQELSRLNETLELRVAEEVAQHRDVRLHRTAVHDPYAVADGLAVDLATCARSRSTPPGRPGAAALPVPIAQTGS